MARDFSGTNEFLSFGSDAGIDGFTTKTVAAWIQRDEANVVDLIVAKDRAVATWAVFVTNDSQSNVLQLYQTFSGTDGEWDGGSVTTELTHIAVVYDSSDAANDPVLYVNGVAVTVSEGITPTGSAESDAAASFRAGESGSGGSDYNGAIQNLTYVNALWTADQVNRHRWWGRVGGAIAFHHPLLTTKLTNEGTATANGTATGTAMRSLPRVERNWGAMMGCGR